MKRCTNAFTHEETNYEVGQEISMEQWEALPIGEKENFEDVLAEEADEVKA